MEEIVLIEDVEFVKEESFFLIVFMLNIVCVN